MQSSKEQQREIRKPFSVINANKQRKIIEREREIERELLKKIRDTKRTFHAKMGIMKDRDGMDLTEAEDIEEVDHRKSKRIPEKTSTPALLIMPKPLTV